MLTLRKAEDRGHTDLGWLSSFHTFSFGGYNDPNHMGFRSLRVLNDDRVAPGKGFGAHGHRDMEILSYVITGKLAHKDSMGEQHELGPNEVQAMTAEPASSTANSTARTMPRRTSCRSGSCPTPED